jgi:hypothetical protein
MTRVEVAEWRSPQNSLHVKFSREFQCNGVAPHDMLRVTSELVASENQFAWTEVVEKPTIARSPLRQVSQNYEASESDDQDRKGF